MGMVGADDNVLLSLTGQKQSRSIEFIGNPISSTVNMQILERHKLGPGILVQIGHLPTGLPAEIFAGVVVIDNRPVKGGGLPDFWEATIGKVCRLAYDSQWVRRVYVIGNSAFAQESINRLTNIRNWVDDIEHLSYKIGVSHKAIMHFADKLSDTVLVADDEEQLLENYVDLCSENGTLLHEMFVSGRTTVSAFLRRKVDGVEHVLTDTDGCRAPTISNAFPIAVNAVRQRPIEEQVHDDAGQTLKELCSYKIHLTDPERDCVPIFYSKEKELLEKYYSRAFEDPDGLFRSKLDEYDQLEIVIKFLAGSIIGVEDRVATRRGILVVPNSMSNGDIEPLGLISIHILPRQKPRHTALNFCFNWRSVEALVGLPYSLFGSVKFAIFLTDRITRLTTELDSSRRQISIGNVSYIAGSLHMSAEQTTQNIAKTIVDEASD